MFYIYIFHKNKNKKIIKKTIFYLNFYPLIQSINKMALQRYPNRNLAASFTIRGYFHTGI